MTDAPDAPARPNPVRAASLEAVPHGFMTREGGVSKGIYAGLNVGLGSDDDRSAIQENRHRVVEAVLPEGRLVTLHQVHSADAVAAIEPYPDGERPHADALVTDRPGLLLGILTADCTPVLLADAQAGVVGAAHAGWKGALNGITDTTVEQMVLLGADRDRIVAAIGPCIGRASYEVDEAFFQRFVETAPENERFFSGGIRPDHHQFDLEAYVAARLASAGVRHIELLGLDTYSDERRFFSFRRATHRGEPGYGRQISVIGLPIS